MSLITQLVDFGLSGKRGRSPDVPFLLPFYSCNVRRGVPTMLMQSIARILVKYGGNAARLRRRRGRRP